MCYSPRVYRLQVAGLAAVETGLAAIAGIALGWLGFQVARRILAGQLTLGHGTPIFVEDVDADGSLWVSTSNRDQVGRGDGLPQKPEGDIILRLTPTLPS